MITYNRSAFGINLIFRLHGSAVYRAVVPSLVAVGIYLALRLAYNGSWRTVNIENDELAHPYAIGALLASATFLVVFRANQGYSRYWEGASAAHHMMSKWMDATVHSCVFHMQCDHYKEQKPPSYFDYPELNHLYMTRDRERGNLQYEDEPLDEHANAADRRSSEIVRTRLNRESTHTRSVGALESIRNDPAMLQEERHKRKWQAVVKSINYVELPKKGLKVKGPQDRAPVPPEMTPRRSHSLGDIYTMDIGADSSFFDQLQHTENKPGTGKPFPMPGRPRMDGNWKDYYTPEGDDTPKATFFNPHQPDEKPPVEGFASIQGGRTPPLFLQELAHLSSLLVAVSLSTLRNDIDGAQSPLTSYTPGSDWPEVDPDKDEWMKLSNMGNVRHMWRKVKHFLGMGRSPEEQTRYNAGRPLPVIGGVSDAEIRFLQMAKGPYAKTQLCWNWLSEFVIREHLAGSMGKVGPPIVSRIIQFMSDGMIYYNHARKVMFIPFPYVHAQLSSLFILVTIPAIPYLMDQYTNEVWLGATLTFFTTLCLSGTHEVAREMENPFRNVPNELPLVTLQAHYNEALITMYSGYHPDQYWDGERILRKRKAGKDASTKGPLNGKPASSSPSASLQKENAELVQLKKQLDEQAKLIEKLSAKVNLDPIQQTQQLDQIVEEAISGMGSS